MKRHHDKLSISLMITLFCLGSLLTTAFWTISDNSHLVPSRPPSPKKIPPWPSDLCKGCRALIEKVRERYSKTWKKQEDNYRNLSSQLRSQCQGFDRAIITQANTPVGSNIVYAVENKKTLKVTPEIFSTFIKENPFPKKKWDTCAVVGNSGILTNSSCGEMIDSAQFVIRCNLPSLGKGYEKHVGTKTDLVTANPSILTKEYGDLMGPRRPFVESLHSYGKSIMVLSPFTNARTTPVCLRAVYSIRDFESPIQPMFFNPDYFQSLALFWSSRGLTRGRLSTGLVMVNIALEHCANVHLYGFWPFSNHPFELNAVKNHYYDDKKGKWTVHSMPAEFDLLLQLHSQGVLRLHLGNCRPGRN
ncbi:alpha-2,8-sialyltransferase 8F-like [Trematomus bernacchii]|uniref:alpha-2,8-sialyltransferase 8F-like n=1 Tax=Trematomus bernacchii TaxID=40690 RepID=UPI00146CCFB7|nr:alpha-2,8-sialyltransferase 8F-like [Trematomus bernacchii]